MTYQSARLKRTFGERQKVQHQGKTYLCPRLAAAKAFVNRATIYRWFDHGLKHLLLDRGNGRIARYVADDDLRAWMARPSPNPPAGAMPVVAILSKYKLTWQQFYAILQQCGLVTTNANLANKNGVLGKHAFLTDADYRKFQDFVRSRMKPRGVFELDEIEKKLDVGELTIQRRCKKLGIIPHRYLVRRDGPVAAGPRKGQMRKRRGLTLVACFTIDQFQKLFEEGKAAQARAAANMAKSPFRIKHAARFQAVAGSPPEHPFAFNGHAAKPEPTVKNGTPTPPADATAGEPATTAPRPKRRRGRPKGTFDEVARRRNEKMRAEHKAGTFPTIAALAKHHRMSRTNASMILGGKR